MILQVTKYSDIYDFLDSKDSKVFRMWKHKKCLNTNEIQKTFSDASIYVNDICELVFFTEIIPMGDDYMLGYVSADNRTYKGMQEAPEIEKVTRYVRLSEIEFCIANIDQELKLSEVEISNHDIGELCKRYVTDEVVEYFNANNNGSK